MPQWSWDFDTNAYKNIILAAMNDDPEVSGSDNAVLPLIREIYSSHPNSTRSITASLSKNMTTCLQIRSDLNEDPIGVVLNVRVQLDPQPG